MARSVTIAALQLPAWAEGDTSDARRAFRLTQIEHWLHEAGRAGADIACLGEAALGQVSGTAEDAAVIEDADDGPAVQLVSAIAREHRMHVILPLVARHAGQLRNLAVVIDRGGQVVGHYCKVHPTRVEMAAGIVEGDEFPAFDLDFGCIGIVICHDLSFPEATRVLGLRGAEIIFWPSWWSGWGEELNNAVIRSRAIDNAVYLVHVSFGQPANRAWRPGMVLGCSGVIGSDGLVLSSAGRSVGMALTTVDLDRPRIAHCFSWDDEYDFRQSMLADRRPRAYQLIADESIVPPARPGPVDPPSARTL